MPSRAALTWPALFLALLLGIAVTMIWIGAPLWTDEVRAPVDFVADFEPLKSATPDAPPLHNRLLSDWPLQFHPWRKLVRDEWRAGRAPLWNQWNGTGQPLAANQQSEAFSPYLPLSLLFTDQYPDAKLAAQTVLALFFMLLLARRMGFSFYAALLTALAWAFSSYMQVWAVHPHAGSATFGPLVTLGLLDLRRGQVSGLVVAASGLGLSILAGHIETAFLCGMCGAVWTFFDTPRGREGIRQRLVFVPQVLMAGVLGVGLAALVVVPFFEYLAQSDVEDFRAAQPVRTLPWQQISTLLDPFRFGHPTDPARPYIGAPNFVEGTLFVGRVAFLLAMIGLVIGLKHRRSLVWSLTTTALLGLVMAYAPRSWHSIVAALPPFDRMPLPRLSFLAILPLILLAGLGLDHLIARFRSRGWMFGAAVCLLAAAEFLVVWHGYIPIGPADLLSRTSPLLEDLKVKGEQGRVFSAGDLLRPELNAAWSIPVLRSYDAILPRRFFRWVFLSGAFYGPNFAQSAVFCPPAILDAASVRWLLTPWPAADSPGLGLSAYLNDGGMESFPVISVDGAKFECLVHRGASGSPRDGLVAFEILGPDGRVQRFSPMNDTTEESGAFGVFSTRPDAAVRDLLRNNFEPFAPVFVSFRFHGSNVPLQIRVRVLERGAPASFLQVIRGGFGTDLVPDRIDRGFHVTERVSAMPRVYLAPGIVAVRDFDAAVARLLQPDFSPRRETLVEPSGDVVVETNHLNRAELESCEILHHSSRRLSVRAVTDRPSLLVSTDLSYPGWRARVEGSDELLPIHPVNVVARGVRLEAGHHVVHFEYEPESFRLGLAVSLASFLILVAIIFRGRRSSPDNV